MNARNPAPAAPAGHPTRGKGAGPLARVMWATAYLPRGPLGWVNARWTMPMVLGPIYPSMAAALQLREDDDLLEVGCGAGLFLAEQAARVGHVAGVDLSPIQVELARRRLADRIAARTAEITLGDAADLPWPDGRFSAVTSIAAFMTFPRPAQVLAEIHRVLRPGGRAVLHIGERTAPRTPTHRGPSGIWVWSETDARHMVERAGFTDVAVSYADASGHRRFARFVNRVAKTQDARLVQGVKV